MCVRNTAKRLNRTNGTQYVLKVSPTFCMKLRAKRNDSSHPILHCGVVCTIIVQDQLATTSSSYEKQLSTMSDHLCELNDKMMRQSEELEVLRRNKVHYTQPLSIVHMCNYMPQSMCTFYYVSNDVKASKQINYTHERNSEIKESWPRW